MPNRKDLRPCKYSGNMVQKNEGKIRNGYFHLFLQETEEQNEGNVHYPCAVVEDAETGDVFTVWAQCITFTDLQEQSDIHDMSSAD